MHAQVLQSYHSVFFLFLQTFHCVCRVADVLIDLQQHGNIHYLCWSLSFSCNAADIVSALSAQAHTMESHLEEWKNEVSEKRDKFYELNYFTTQQLLFLVEDLAKLQAANGKNVNPMTMALLQSISPKLSERNVRKHLLLAFDQSDERSDEYSALVVQPLVQEKFTKHSACTSDVDKLVVAEADSEGCPNQGKKESPGSVFMKDGHKAGSMARDCTLMPEPKSTTKHLTDNQHKILINVSENYGFAKKLVFLAFEHCETPETEHEVIDWCMEHQTEFLYEDSDASSESSASDKENSHELEGEVQNLSFIHKIKIVLILLLIRMVDKELDLIQESTEPLQINATESLKANVPHVDAIPQVPVNEQHPVVIKLQNLGYRLEECIEAAELHPENAVDAQNYLIQKEAGDLFSFALVKKRFVVGGYCAINFKLVKISLFKSVKHFSIHVYVYI